MTDKDFDSGVPGEDDPVVERGPQGPDETPGSSPQGDDRTDREELTVDDILGANQTDDALTGDDAVDLPPEAAGYLADLKRLTAEYANYRRRTEEQREDDQRRAKAAAVKGLVPVLDDLDRADKHGDLIEGSAFAAIADKVRVVAERMGVTAYGAAGDTFDPQQHEAIFQVPTPGATASTILEVVEVGYRLDDLEIRPAKVVVAVPAE